MRFKKSVAVLLMICLMLASLSMAAFARQTLHPIISLGDTVEVEITQDSHITYYSFTPEADGIYVFYDTSNQYLSQLSVHSLAPEEAGFGDSQIASGTSRVCFQATAGTSYWLMLDCWYATGEPVNYRFALTEPVEPEKITLDPGLTSGFVGDEAQAGITYSPLNATGDLTWSSSDPAVVTVMGNDDSAAYQLVGPGTATVTATAANGVSASFNVTVTAKQTLELDTDKVVTIPSAGGAYQSLEQTYYFTAETAGNYALSVSYVEGEHACHALQMSVRTDSGAVYGSKSLVFSAQAGETCQVDVEFWGTCQKDVDYTFCVQSCIPGQSFQLKADSDGGYVGSFLNIQALWSPVNSWPEELTWISSDPAVANVKTAEPEYGVLELLAPGTVTITATSASGLSDSVQITVLEPQGVIEVFVGAENPVILPGTGAANISISPAQSGYYQLRTDNADLAVSLSLASIIDGGRRLYYLEAGQTYTGYVENYSSSLASGNILATQEELVSISALTVTRQPNTTTYLKSELDGLWTYQILAGLELRVTWSDGSTTDWRFSDEGPYIGNESLTWVLVDAGQQGKRELKVTCGGKSASCVLTVLDTTVVGIELVDSSPVEIIRNSCGYMDGGSWQYTPYLAYLRDVRIRFSDGSSVIARAGDNVYGDVLTCGDQQYLKPWGQGGEDSVTFSYQGFTAKLQVKIVESTVERIELLQAPLSSFALGDRAYFSGGGSLYFFRAERVGTFAEGLVMRIVYQDGLSRIISGASLEWKEVQGVSYPFLDGYPLGISNDLAAGLPVTGVGELAASIEFMGATAEYTIRITDPVPATGDESLFWPAVIGLLACVAIPVCKKRFF